MAVVLSWLNTISSLKEELNDDQMTLEKVLFNTAALSARLGGHGWQVSRVAGLMLLPAQLAVKKYDWHTFLIERKFVQLPLKGFFF